VKSLFRRLRACLVPIAGLLLAMMILAGVGLAATIVTVTQKGRAFTVAIVEIAAGDTLRFSNEDDFTHQIYVDDPNFDFDSEEQQPGEVVNVRFPSRGTFQVRCHIHPKMHLTVTVR
jgi:plastocyanin